MAQVTKMEFIAQALTYPESRRSFTLQPAATPQAISDLRAFVAQKVDVIVIFAGRRRGAAANRQGGHRGRHPRRLA